METTPAQRALIAACCVAAGVASFVLPMVFAHGGTFGAGQTPTSASRIAPSQNPTASASTVSSAPESSAQTPGSTVTHGVTSSVQSGNPVGASNPVTTTQRPPAPVSGLRLASNTWTTFTLAWLPPRGAGAIASYRVLLNGYQVAQTPHTGVTLAWLNTPDKLLVQVAAVDRRGLLSEWRALVIIPLTPPVTPSASPTTPSASASASNSPSGTPSGGSGSTSSSASVSASAAGSDASARIASTGTGTEASAAATDDVAAPTQTASTPAAQPAG